MSEIKKKSACSEKSYIVHRSDLPLSCPSDEMDLMHAHPKVYLAIEKTGMEICPYCGAHYTLKED